MVRDPRSGRTSSAAHGRAASIYRGKFYDYPIVPMNVLRNLGLVEAVRCVCSYLWVRLHPPRDQSTRSRDSSRRDSVGACIATSSRRTARRSGACRAAEISADWGAQRIKDLSLFRAVWEAMTPKRLRNRRQPEKQVTSLIDEFNYPKYGPGMMWERCADIVTERGDEGEPELTRHRDTPRERSCRRSDDRDRRCPDAIRVHARDLVDADRHAPAERCTRMFPKPSAPRPTLCGTARTSRSRSSLPETDSFHRQLDLHQRSRTSRSVGSRTSAAGRPISSRTGARVSDSSCFVERG